MTVDNITETDTAASSDAEAFRASFGGIPARTTSERGTWFLLLVPVTICVAMLVFSALLPAL